MTIKAILLDASEIKKKGANESPTVFAKRLHGAMLDLPDEDWDKVPDVAQHWVNDVTKALDEHNEIPETLLESLDEDLESDDDADEEQDEEEAEEEEEEPEEETDDDGEETEDDNDEEEPEEEEEEEEEEEKPRAKKRKAPPPKKKVAAKKKKVAVAKKKRTAAIAKAPSATQKIHGMLFEDPEMTVDDLIDVLNQDELHLTEFSVHSIRSNWRSVAKSILTHDLASIKALKGKLLGAAR